MSKPPADRHSENLRVLHIYEPTHGGVPNYVATLARGQSKAGIEVHVAAPPNDSVTYDSFRFHSLPESARSPRRWAYWAEQAKRTQASLEPDIIHLHSFFAGLLRFSRLPPPNLYQPHAWPFLDRRPPRRQIATVAERLAARHSSGSLLLSLDELTQALDARISGRHEIIGTAIDLERFHPSRQLGREILGLEGSRPIVVCMGRVSHQKGQDQLGTIWRLLDALTESDLYIVGPGATDLSLPDTAYLRQGRIFYLNETSRPEFWLAAADLVILPSRWEGLSLTAAEAMACGTPVVAFNVTSMDACLTAGPLPPAGAVVPVGDLAGFARAIAHRLDDRSVLLTESRMARLRAESLFSLDNLVERVTSHYRHALAAT